MISRMKVLLINNNYLPMRGRGALEAVKRLADGLAADGLDMVVADANPCRELSKRHDGAITVYDLPYAQEEDASPQLKQAATRRRLQSLSGVIESERPDIAHTHSILQFTPVAWKLIKDHGLPVVHSVHQYYLMCAENHRFRDEIPCQETCPGCTDHLEACRKASAHVDAVAGVSRFVLDKHLEAGFFPNAAIKEVIYGSPGTRFDDKPAVAKGAPLRCGFMGWLEPIKGAEWLVGMLPHLPREGWSLRFAGAGQKQNMARLRSRATTFPNVRFEGFIDGPAFLSEIDLLIVPSLVEEPLSLAALEALSAGVPILTTGRGGLSEVTQMMPEQAFLFDPDRPETFQSIMKTFIAAPDTLRKLAAGCAAGARKRFNDADTCAGYRRLYEALLKQ